MRGGNKRGQGEKEAAMNKAELNKCKKKQKKKHKEKGERKEGRRNRAESLECSKSRVDAHAASVPPSSLSRSLRHTCSLTLSLQQSKLISWTQS